MTLWFSRSLSSKAAPNPDGVNYMTAARCSNVALVGQDHRSYSQNSYAKFGHYPITSLPRFSQLTLPPELFANIFE